MIKMFSQMFTAIAVFFAAFEKAAKAFDHMATYVEESADSFNDKARLERRAEIAKLTSDLNLTSAA